MTTVAGWREIHIFREHVSFFKSNIFHLDVHETNSAGNERHAGSESEKKVRDCLPAMLSMTLPWIMELSLVVALTRLMEPFTD
jgi:hypothetical protein